MAQARWSEVATLINEAGRGPVSLRWHGVDGILPVLEQMRNEGAVILVKLDGERTSSRDNGPYTVVVSGAPLGGDFIRTDAHSLESAFSVVLWRYAKRAWSPE